MRISFFKWECIQVSLDGRLTTPGDKGVKFSNFLYCSKVKNCSGKDQDKSAVRKWHLCTHTHPHMVYIKKATLKTHKRKGGTTWRLHVFSKRTWNDGTLWISDLDLCGKTKVSKADRSTDLFIWPRAKCQQDCFNRSFNLFSGFRHFSPPSFVLNVSDYPIFSVWVLTFKVHTSLFPASHYRGVLCQASGPSAPPNPPLTPIPVTPLHVSSKC